MVSMILCDDQAGSRDLFPYIKALTPDVVLTRVDPPFGDLVWVGEAEGGGSTDVAVEYKKLDDVMTCMVDGRFAGHQLPGLLAHYPQPARIYLLVEMGQVRADRHTGVMQRRRGDRWWDIQRGNRGFTYRELEHWFTTIEEFARVTVVKTFDEYESARWVTAKHSWWVNKGWDDHKSIKQFHVPPPPAATFLKPNFTRRVVKEFPDIQWDRSGPVANYFGTVIAAVNASPDEWASIVVGTDKNGHTLTIGANRGMKIWKALRGITK